MVLDKTGKVNLGDQVAIIAPNCVRVTLVGEYLNRPALNVMDMVVADANAPDTREDAVKFAAAQVGKVWTTTVMQLLSSSYSLERVDYLDLSEEDGVVGSLTEVDGVSLPQTGDLSGDPITAAVALLVTKQTVARRGQRQGRMFIAGLTEGYVNGNILDSSYQGPMNDELDTFLASITETSPIAQNEYFPTVIHTRNEGTAAVPNIVYTGNSQITGLSVSGRVSTQRRRNRP